MIRLKRITTSNGFPYEYMEQLITTSFPPEEYRPLEDLRQYTTSKSHFYNNIIYQQNNPIGIITYWDFGHFYYIEHFAIDPSQRNGGYGKEVLNHLFELLHHPIILEVEAPAEEMAQRRINFYQRQGFALWKNTSYEQPPYRKGDSYLPMLLMAYGDLDAEKDFSSVKERLYQDIYHVTR